MDRTDSSSLGRGREPENGTPRRLGWRRPVDRTDGMRSDRGVRRIAEADRTIRAGGGRGCERGDTLRSGGNIRTHRDSGVKGCTMAAPLEELVSCWIDWGGIDVRLAPDLASLKHGFAGGYECCRPDA